MRTEATLPGNEATLVALATLFGMLSLACVPGDGGDLEGAAASSADATAGRVLSRYDFSRETRSSQLPGRLDEISGLAFTADGRLFAHDDERGRVHEIDPLTGEVGKRFDLGDPVVRGDFEGIAIAGDRFFLVTSLGFLYEFREGEDRATLGYRMTDTRVGASCEVEGLDHDPLDDALLFACKVNAPDRGEIVVHRIPLDPRRDPLAPLRVPKAALVRHGLEPHFDPSAIVVDPSGSFILLAGRQQALIEVDRSGRVVAGVALSRNRHRQPEGLEIGPDLTLHISDERNRGDARWTAYARVDTVGSE